MINKGIMDTQKQNIPDQDPADDQVELHVQDHLVIRFRDEANSQLVNKRG